MPLLVVWGGASGVVLGVTFNGELLSGFIPQGGRVLAKWDLAKDYEKVQLAETLAKKAGPMSPLMTDIQFKCLQVTVIATEAGIHGVAKFAQASTANEFKVYLDNEQIGLFKPGQYYALGLAPAVVIETADEFPTNQS